MDLFKRVFPTSQVDTVNSFSEESFILAALLLKITKEPGILLSDLTTFINEYITQHNYSKQLGVQSIYKLVGFELVIIDRTSKESIVQLK